MTNSRHCPWGGYHIFNACAAYNNNCLEEPNIFRSAICLIYSQLGASEPWQKEIHTPEATPNLRVKLKITAKWQVITNHIAPSKHVRQHLSSPGRWNLVAAVDENQNPTYIHSHGSMVLSCTIIHINTNLSFETQEN